MIHFPVLRTGIASITLREISIRDAIAIAAMPVQDDEAAITLFLQSVIQSVTGIPENPLDWTVEYRLLAVCHYLASVLPDGPDFTLGNGDARYSDYLDGANDKIPDPVEIGNIGGDSWKLRQLTGRMAEAIERTNGSIETLSGRLHWMVGMMACQLYREGDMPPPEYGVDDWLAERINVIASYPESDFTELLAAYSKGKDSLYHLFRMDLAEVGLIVLPKEATAALPSARFPVRSCISEISHKLGRWIEGTGTQSDPVRGDSDTGSDGDD